MTKKNVEFLFGGVMLLIGAALLAHTYSDKYLATGIGVEFGPVFYPRVLLWGWIILSAAMLVENLFITRKYSSEKYLWGNILLMMVLIAATIFLLDIIGFLASTILFFISSCYLFGYRKPWRLALIGVGMPLCNWFIFQEILQIQLPNSIFFYWV